MGAPRLRAAINADSSLPQDAHRDETLALNADPWTADKKPQEIVLAEPFMARRNKYGPDRDLAAAEPQFRQSSRRS